MHVFFFQVVSLQKEVEQLKSHLQDQQQQVEQQLLTGQGQRDQANELAKVSNIDPWVIPLEWHCRFQNYYLNTVHRRDASLLFKAVESTACLEKMAVVQSHQYLFLLL